MKTRSLNRIAYKEKWTPFIRMSTIAKPQSLQQRITGIANKCLLKKDSTSANTYYRYFGSGYERKRLVFIFTGKKDKSGQEYYNITAYIDGIETLSNINQEYLVDHIYEVYSGKVYNSSNQELKTLANIIDTACRYLQLYHNNLAKLAGIYRRIRKFDTKLNLTMHNIHYK